MSESTQKGLRVMAAGDVIDAKGSNAYEYTSNKCFSFEVGVSLTTDPNSTSGVNVSITKKIGEGTPIVRKGLTETFRAKDSGLIYIGEYTPGTVVVVFNNFDDTYAATIDGIWIKENV